jgi:glucokinase
MLIPAMSEDRLTISLDQAQRPFYAGVDLGGTNIKVGLVDDLGRGLAFAKIETQSELGPESGAQRMGQAVLDLIEQLGITAADVPRVGLATPGTMDVPKGMLLEPHNLPGWYHFPIRDRVSQHCGLPVTYANDAGAAAYGEYWVGTGRQLNSMILLTLGTGVGGGIIIGDQSIDGEHSTGAECGHITIDCRDDARICGCGRPGHLEAYASATALIARTEEALDTGRDSTMQALRESGQEITPLLIAGQAEAGDALSRELVLDTAAYLGVGIATLMATIDPSGVVLGGAMTFGGHQSPLGREFLARVKQEVSRRSLTPIVENMNIDFASLGGAAGSLGAAGLARIEARKPQSA